MRHSYKIIALLFFFSAPFLCAENNVTATLHNLSAVDVPGVTRSVKASDAGDTRVCVFCHIPHAGSTVAAPLWNKKLSTANYTLYDSDYLRRTGYIAANPLLADLGSDGGPGTRSRQCLSCHDGTVAVGSVSVYNAVMDVSMAMTGSGVDAGGKLKSTAMGYIGTDLSTHHPVGYRYDSSAAIARSFGDGNATTVELKPKATVDMTKIKLYTYTGANAGDYVECASCHNPHTTNDKFLRVDTVGNNHAENIVETCTSCHDKEGWSGSIHQSAANTYTDANVSALYGTSTVGDLGCINCHTPHNGEGKPYLLRKDMAQTCFQGAAGTEATAPCHSTGGPKDIKSVLGRTYPHPVLDSSEHTNLDVLYGTGNTEPDEEPGKGVKFSDSKHSVCMDCHNPHKAQAGTHAVPADPVGWYPASPNPNTNLVSNVLQGATGVEPTWPATPWTQPTSFTTKKTAEREYQICMKCHSYWGLGTATNGQSSYFLDAEPTVPLTDLAFELAPQNAAGHPVVVTLNNRAGSTAPKALDPLQLKDPWKTNNGDQTMYCSDCHGSDNELAGDPRGPHGSDLKYVLKGLNQYWPKKSTGVLWNTNDLSGGGWGGGAGDYTGLFCSNCHNLMEPHKNQWSWIMENRDINCVECHQVIVHGSSVPRLLGYSDFPAPYNYNGNSLKMTEYIKTPLTTVNVDNAQAPGCGGGKCHGGGGGGGW